MPEYSEQDLKYAAEFCEELHKEALSIVRKTRPNVTEVIDRHPVEDFFREHWDYPGKWYTVVAIPNGYCSRKEFVDSIVSDTLSGSDNNIFGSKNVTGTDWKPQKQTNHMDDPFYLLLAEYPDLVVDYFIVQDNWYCGYESHRMALKFAYDSLSDEWTGDPNSATGKIIPAEKLMSSEDRNGKLNYRKAFLDPPHKISYSENDFKRVNDALFPNGTDELEVYEWSTDWSDYFDDGREWWGTLCLTVYDKTLNRFVVIMASATD